mmetsp:Transcript_127021/g.247505  ORF Transcript_127021/g.247505 Transcript_127021/m.247505 type:complete len:340 (+) Transcript_127021:508-1527(+)
MQPAKSSGHHRSCSHHHRRELGTKQVACLEASAQWQQAQCFPNLGVQARTQRQGPSRGFLQRVAGARCFQGSQLQAQNKPERCWRHLATALCQSHSALRSRSTKRRLPLPLSAVGVVALPQHTSTEQSQRRPPVSALALLALPHHTEAEQVQRRPSECRPPPPPEQWQRHSIKCRLPFWPPPPPPLSGVSLVVLPHHTMIDKLQCQDLLVQVEPKCLDKELAPRIKSCLLGSFPAVLCWAGLLGTRSACRSDSHPHQSQANMSSCSSSIGIAEHHGSVSAQVDAMNVWSNNHPSQKMAHTASGASTSGRTEHRRMLFPQTDAHRVAENRCGSCSHVHAH